MLNPCSEMAFYPRVSTSSGDELVTSSEPRRKGTEYQIQEPDVVDVDEEAFVGVQRRCR
jgi:hypothetical protein